MKLLAKLATLTLVIGMTSNVIAATISSTIPLNSGKILPGKDFVIATDKLYKDYEYTVTCTMTNRGAVNAKSEFTLLRNRSKYYAYIDGKLIDIQSVTHFNSIGSSLKIMRVIKDEAIWIRNLDYTDNYEIEDCKAYLDG